MELLQATNLSKSFGSNKAVDDVSLVVRAGEFVSLVGSNGAGKTTLVNLISAYLRPDSGRIRFEGKDITVSSVNERIKAGIARSFQIVNLFDGLPCLDNIALSIFARERMTYAMAQFAYRDVKIVDEALEVLEQFGLGAKPRELAGKLAQGERKLLDVAIAYALRPRLLFLDEPTSGVSTRDKAGIMDRISAVIHARGMAGVIIEHDMDIVFRYSDRIVVMHQGRVLADGTPDEVGGSDDVSALLLGGAIGAAAGQHA
jgi:branched-chain amino acid transport system ATP-binding protein